MTDVDALTAFCRARIDEEERDAKAVLDEADFEHWLAHAPEMPVIEAHVARQDPAATLARVAALRALVDWAELRLSTKPTDPDDADAVESAHEDARDVLRHLAAIWRDHPDYQPEWGDHSTHHRHTRGSRIECQCGAYMGLVSTTYEASEKDVCRVCRATGVLYLDG